MKETTAGLCDGWASEDSFERNLKVSSMTPMTTSVAASPMVGLNLVAPGMHFQHHRPHFYSNDLPSIYKHRLENMDATVLLFGSVLNLLT